MNSYSKQLIAELAENLDRKIVSFFEDTKLNRNYPVDKLTELIEYTLENMVGSNTNKDELRIVYTGEMKNRRKKKARWLAKLEEEVQNLDPSDERHPFYELYFVHNFLRKDQWESLYGKKTIEEVIFEQTEAAREWNSKSGSYLISYPAIATVPKGRVFDSLVSDTFVWIFQYVLDNYDGSIENYFIPILDQLIGFPLFAPSRNRLSTTINENGELVDIYMFGENVLETSGLSHEKEQKLVAMDQNDLMILQKSLNYLTMDFYNSRQVRVKKRTLAKIFNDRPSKKHYESMEEHCHRLTQYNFRVKKNGKVIHSFNLIDSVINDEENDEMILIYGNFLYKSIVEKQLTNTKSSVYQILENSLSKILYQALFRELVLFSSKNNGPGAEFVADYSYDFFSSNVRLPYHQKTKNMALIAESLDEFYRNNLLIKYYERISPLQFRIAFYPLTDNERADLDFNHFAVYTA